MPLPDLISQPYLASLLAGYGLSAAELAALPSLTTSASRIVREYCSRGFTRREVDGPYTAAPGEPVLLREYPVNAVLRCAGNPTPVLSIACADPAVPRATVALATSGDLASGLVVVGLALTRYAGGLPVAASVPFATCPTVGQVAAAVDALGSGWTATADPQWSAWPSADFRAAQGVLPAAQGRSASLLIHTDDLPFTLDSEAGILDLGSPGRGDDPWGPRWFPNGGTRWGDQDLEGARGGLRVAIDCGFDSIPEDVQLYTAETVKAIVDRLRTDSSLSGEVAGPHSYVTRDLLTSAPKWVLAGLERWRIVRT